ncbi:MAG: poly(A) polymerase [Spirochaetes bacterium]|nr:MAG: poly(A) polymerase [Spirochaetota bacterium]
MFIRYRRDINGVPVPHANIYSQAEHHIDSRLVDVEAVRIVERLKAAGYQAYIVGGAVRDLSQGRAPKDFDLVTDALPTKIRKLFRNARIIGKRFKLVHIIQGGTIYEVSTFRSIKNGSVGNEFGTIDEDAHRRDFTFNALYYDPTDQSLLDFVGGFKDLQAGKLKPIIPLDAIFKEDPVRIIRGLKYAAIGGFSIPLTLRRAIKKESILLAGVSPSRMTEEFFKILASGHAGDIFKILCDFKVVEYFVPTLWEKMQSDIEFSRLFFKDMEELDALKVTVQDAELESQETFDPYRGKQKISQVLSYFLKAWVARENLQFDDSSEAFRLALHSARTFLHPMNPPRVELEAAVLMIFRNSGISPLQKPSRPRRRRYPSRPRPKSAGD